MIIIQLGEYFIIFSVTEVTIFALVPSRSSLDIPGFLGKPDVIPKVEGRQMVMIIYPNT